MGEAEAREAALTELADMDHGNPQFAVRWRCVAMESDGWRHWGRSQRSQVLERLEDLLRDLPRDRAGCDLNHRAQMALYRAQRAERGPDPVPIDLGDAATIVGTATAVPLVHAFATQAGADVYAWVRQIFSRALGRESDELTERTDVAALYVVGDRAANTWLEMRGRPTDEALAKLAETDLETLAAPDPRGRAVVVCWVPEAGEWQRRLR